MTKNRPSPDQGLPGELPSDRSHRGRRARSEPKLYISYLPDGKGGPREEKGSVPLEVDVEDHIEERSDCEPGLYRIEKKRSGEFSGDVLFYSKEEPDRSRIANTEEEEISVSSDFVKTPADLLNGADLSRLIASTVSTTLEARDRLDRAQQNQPGAIDMLREIEDMAERRVVREQQRREEIRAEIAAVLTPGKSSGPDLDDKTRLQLAVVRETGILPEIFRNMREMIDTTEHLDEPQSWADKILDFAKAFVPYVGPVVGPIIGQRLIGLLGQVDDAALMQAVGVQAGDAQQGTQHGAQLNTSVPGVNESSLHPGSERMNAPITFDDVLEGIIADLQEANEPDDAIDEIAKLTTLQPAFLPVVAQMMAQSNSHLIQTLSQAKGIDLAPLLNADSYIDSLRAGIKKRIRLPELQSTLVEVDGLNESLRHGENGYRQPSVKSLEGEAA